jgi:serine/threonine-protein kinase
MSVDPARWAALSSRLDELLELEGDARDARLAAIRASSPADADDLAALLARLPALEDDGFLQDGAVPPPTGAAGRAVGAYALEREIGRGGMGEVWLARRTDGRYEGHVAIKFLQSGLFGHGDAARFAREGSILARLSHPHIARLLDAGVTDDPHAQPYLVLEYVDGVAIDRYCADQALPVRAILALLLDVLDAVAHAHTRLILHRDLKPSNILVDAGGHVKLLDFGIAKLLDDSAQAAGATEITQRAGAAFTPLYAAPEQVQGLDVTTATDVYALGVLMYRLLAGAHPIEGAATGSTLERLKAVVEFEPRRLSETVARSGAPGAARRARELRGDLDTIVAKALKKAPAERYANAAAFADDVRRALLHEPLAARPDGAGYRLAKFVRRHRAGVAAGTVATLALALGVGVALVQAREAHQQRVQAEGLVEYMIGDLRKKLQPVGRLDALDGVGTKALAYYAAQDPSRLDADSLGRRARALHLIGEIAEQRGRLDEAARMFRDAAESTGELLSRHPNDGQRVFDHAQSEYWVGLIGRRQGRLVDEEAGLVNYLALAERLVAIDAANADWRMEKAYASENMGMLRLDGARPAEALAWYEKARVLLEAEPATRADVNVELANVLGWIARAHEQLGDYRASLDALEAKGRVIARSPDAASDSDLQFLRANGLHEQARMRLWIGDPTAAEALEDDGLVAMRALTARDPANLDWQAAEAIADFGLADVRATRRDEAGAHAALAAGAAIVERLMAKDASKAYFALTLQGRMLGLRAALSPGHDPALTAALAAFADALPAHEGQGQTLDIDQMRVAAAALLALGDREAADDTPGAAARARTHWQATLAHTARDAARGQAPALALRAQALLRLGDAPAARALARRLDATALRTADVDDLHRRLAAAPRAATPAISTDPAAQARSAPVR